VKGGLKNLLESEQVTKVFYDVRADNDALYHLHGVEVRAAYDLQIMWHVKFQNPAEMYLQGLKRVFNEFLQKARILSPAQMDAMERLKLEGQQYFLHILVVHMMYGNTVPCPKCCFSIPHLM